MRSKDIIFITSHNKTSEIKHERYVINYYIYTHIIMFMI